MTDPKLVEKPFKWLDDMTTEDFIKHIFRWGMQSFPLKPELFKKEMGKAIGQAKYREALALQSHGDEVRRKTVEECAKVAESKLLFISITDPYQYDGDISESIRKLLEVKP